VNAGGSNAISTAKDGAASRAADAGDARCGSDLPRVQNYEPDRAARGKTLFERGSLTPGI
jgi:hypothetical protein